MTVQTNPLLQATLSHYRAQRDKCLAELDILLNHAVGVGDHAKIVEDTIDLFARLDNADSILKTVTDVIMGNTQPQIPSKEITPENNNETQNQ